MKRPCWGGKQTISNKASLHHSSGIHNLKIVWICHRDCARCLRHPIPLNDFGPKADPHELENFLPNGRGARPKQPDFTAKLCLDL